MSLAGLIVVSFESRRAAEMAELVRRYGGEPVSAPSMREVPLTDNPAAREFAKRLDVGEIDVTIFLTGVGTRALARAVEPDLPQDRLAGALAKIVTVARGPKPVAALADLGVRPTVSVPEPNTWREVLAAVDARWTIRGWRVAVQEYGEENPELVAALANRGAEVLRVPVYRWALPEDTSPLHEAARRLRAGEVDVALFTSATQLEHLCKVAGADVARAFAKVAVGSIGPIARQALEHRGIGVDFEPDHPKMGQLVRAASERARSILEAKRG